MRGDNAPFQTVRPRSEENSYALPVKDGGMCESIGKSVEGRLVGAIPTKTSG